MSGMLWSNVALWIVVSVQWCAIVALFHYQGRAIIGTKVRNQDQGPRVGTQSPALDAHNVLGESVVTDMSSSRLRAVIFVTATCRECHFMFEALKELPDLPTLERTILFVCRGSEEGAKELVQRFSLETDRVVADPDGRIVKQWDVFASPFVVALDANGVVVDRGRPGSASRLAELLSAGKTEVSDQPTQADPASQGGAEFRASMRS